jgi:hypothetical protein
MARSSKAACLAVLVMAAGALLLLQPASAQTCGGMYRRAGKPLLFGGVAEPKRCVKNCQSRTDFW